MSEKWQELYFGALVLDPDFRLVIPIDALPGETREDTAYRYFVEQGILKGNDESWITIDMARARELDPNIAKFLEAAQLAELTGILENLEAKGYVYSSVDETGELIYGLTGEGKKELEALRSQNN